MSDSQCDESYGDGLYLHTMGRKEILILDYVIECDIAIQRGLHPGISTSVGVSYLVWTENIPISI